MKNWYLLYCKRGQLLRAQHHLDLQHINNYSPMVQIEKVVRNKRMTFTEPAFPNYLFIEFDPEVIHTTTISATRGVSHFIRFGHQLATVPLSLIETLMDTPQAQQIHPNTPYQGDAVHIIEGPFKGVVAIYSEPDGETRSVLLLKLLNQQIEQRVDNALFKKLQ